MFSNIGKKIRIYAMVICWIGIISSIITAISMFITAGLVGRYASIGPIIAGIVILIVGPLMSWLGSFVIYGYGQLIESTQNIERTVCASQQPPMNYAQNQYPYSYAPQNPYNTQQQYVAPQNTVNEVNTAAQEAVENTNPYKF